MSANENCKDKGSAKIDLDHILQEEIGQCGKFQLLIVLQSFVAVVFNSMMVNDFVFTAARIDTRCSIPECEDPASTEFAAWWVTQAVPSVNGAVDNCQRFGNGSTAPGNGTCPDTLFDTSVIQNCQEYVYENTNTVVYDFGLACDEWRRTMIGSIRILGMMLALPLTGMISDRWGRQRALSVNATAAPLVGLLRYWAPNYMVYMGLLFVESVVGLATFTSAFILTVEILGPKYRVLGGATINSAFAVGQIILALIASVITTWRNLLLAIYIPQFCIIFYYWTLSESARWLICKGRFQEAEDVLKKAAKINRREISQKSLNELRYNYEQTQLDNRNESSLISIALKEKRLLVRCLVTCTWWITDTFVYYGLSINAVELLSNKHLSYIVVSAVEVPGYFSVYFLINRFGRKPVAITIFWLCTACQLAFMFISNSVVSQVFYFLGKWAISVAITTVNIFTTELYPTECRHRFYGFSAMVGRVGSTVAPLTPALGVTFFPELPFVMFGSVAFVAGLLTFLVPETRGRNMPDTIREAFPRPSHDHTNNVSPINKY